MLDFLIRSAWLIHFSILLAVWPLVLRKYWRNKPMKSHVACISTSYVLLTAIDVFTVCVENYPPLSLKGVGMLLAFALGAWSLFRMLVRQATWTG